MMVGDGMWVGDGVTVSTLQDSFFLRRSAPSEEDAGESSEQRQRGRRYRVQRAECSVQRVGCRV